jgi:hypothetical protein
MGNSFIFELHVQFLSILCVPHGINRFPRRGYNALRNIEGQTKQALSARAASLPAERRGNYQCARKNVRLIFHNHVADEILQGRPDLIRGPLQEPRQHLQIVLSDIARRPGAAGLRAQVSIVVLSDDHDPGLRIYGRDLACSAEPIEFRHLDIQQDPVGRNLTVALHRLAPVTALHNFRAEFFEH